MSNLDSKIHILCTKGNQRIETWEELSTIIVAIRSPQFRRDVTYMMKTLNLLVKTPLFFVNPS